MMAGRRPRALIDTPASRKFSLASRGDWLWHFQGRPGLVDLSQTQGGTFFREVHQISEMARQNHQIVTFFGVS
jgi:hypothetical protein